MQAYNYKSSQLKKTILIFLFSTLLIACDQKQELKGIWCLTQSNINTNNKLITPYKAFFDFKKDSVKIVSFGDPSTGDYSKVDIVNGTYIYTNSSLTFDVDSKVKFNVTKRNNTIYLSNKELEMNKVEFKQIDSTLINPLISKECFKGSYLIKNENYEDSIDFINDSILLYTGMYNPNFPAKKWEIINYKGINILNIHETFHNIMVIKFCSKDKIILESPFINNVSLALSPTSSNINKSELYGNWLEISDSKSKLPLPPDFDEKELYLRLEIKPEIITTKMLKREKNLKWNISNDGKRIYFLDKIKQYRDESFSWKIISLSEDILTIRISKNSGFKEEIVTLKKVNK